MRTQPSTTSLDDPLDPTGWRAELVDAKGWLTRPGSYSLPARPAGPADNPAESAGGNTRVEVSGAGASARRSAEPAEPRSSTRARRSTRTLRSTRVLRSTRAGRRRPMRTLVRSRPLAVDVATEIGSGVGPAGVGGPQPGDVRAIDGYRMGRWARLTLTVTVLAAIAVVTISLTVGSAPRAMVDVTVGPGDTLWSIAAQAAPDRDPRDVIDEIRQLNDMQGGVLPVGVVLRVPTSGD